LTAPTGFVIVDLFRHKAGLIEKRPKNKIMPILENQKHLLESDILSSDSRKSYGEFLQRGR
jgi:hypothetical protein